MCLHKVTFSGLKYVQGFGYKLIRYSYGDQMMYTVTPAYGRDYKSAKDAVADWNAGKDFVLATIGKYMGKYCNKDSFTDGEVINIRYNKLTQITKVGK
jgi:hypothetical protein